MTYSVSDLVDAFAQSGRLGTLEGYVASLRHCDDADVTIDADGHQVLVPPAAIVPGLPDKMQLTGEAVDALVLGLKP